MINVIIGFIITSISVYLYLNNFQFLNEIDNILLKEVICVIMETIIIITTYIVVRDKAIAICSLAIIEYILYVFHNTELFLTRIITLLFWYMIYLLWNRYKTKGLLIGVGLHLLYNSMINLGGGFAAMLGVIIILIYLLHDEQYSS